MKTTILVAAIVSAIALGACRHEMPHPKGLGAADLAKAQVVKQ